VYLFCEGGRNKKVRVCLECKKNHVPTFSYKFELCEFHVYVAAKKKEGLKVASSNGGKYGRPLLPVPGIEGGVRKQDHSLAAYHCGPNSRYLRE